MMGACRRETDRGPCGALAIERAAVTPWSGTLARRGARVAIALTLAAALAAAAGAGWPGHGPFAGAQSPPAGRIDGTVRNGTAGAATPSALEIRLITLDGDDVIDSRTEIATDGRFTFAVDPSTSLTHVLRAVYADVPYFAEAVSLTPAAPEAERVITVYEATREPPPLSIATTTVTVVALDRASGELTLLREDIVRNPSDRVYVGDASGITYRVPAVDRVVEAGPVVDDARVRFEAGVVTAAIPLLPGETSIVTGYLVQYDRADDRYRLRVTTALAADRMEARVPARFVLSVDPIDGTQREEETSLRGERALVLARSAADPGDSLLVDLVGLSGIARARNPLTEQPGAAIAALIALATLVVGTFATVALGRRRTRGAAS